MERLKEKEDITKRKDFFKIRGQYLAFRTFAGMVIRQGHGDKKAKYILEKMDEKFIDSDLKDAKFDTTHYILELHRLPNYQYKTKIIDRNKGVGAKILDTMLLKTLQMGGENMTFDKSDKYIYEIG